MVSVINCVLLTMYVVNYVLKVNSFLPISTKPVVSFSKTSAQSHVEHTRGVMLRHDRTEGWLEIVGAVSSDP